MIKNLIRAALLSKPVQRIIKEAVQIITKETVETITTIVMGLNKILKENLVKRLEKGSESNVQLHSKSIPNSKSEKQNKSLRLVTT